MRFCAEGVEGGLVDLFSDAKMTENITHHFVGGDGVTGDSTEGGDGKAKVLSDEISGQTGGEGSEGVTHMDKGFGESFAMTKICY